MMPSRINAWSAVTASAKCLQGNVLFLLGKCSILAWCAKYMAIKVFTFLQHFTRIQVPNSQFKYTVVFFIFEHLTYLILCLNRNNCARLWFHILNRSVRQLVEWRVIVMNANVSKKTICVDWKELCNLCFCSVCHYCKQLLLCELK